MIDIHIAKEEHIEALSELERAAAGLFSDIDLPDHLRNETISKQKLMDAQQMGLLLVALEDGTKPVGFAVTQKVGSILHLLELDVHPNYQRQGIGTELMKNIDMLAQKNGCWSITLTTFRHVEWNAPWYERQGFRILRKDEITEHLSNILAQEKAKGLDSTRRVAMKKQIVSA